MDAGYPGLEDAGLSHCRGVGLQLGAPVCAPNSPHRPPHPGASIYSVTLFLYWGGGGSIGVMSRPTPPLPPVLLQSPLHSPLQSSPYQWGGG